MRNYYALPIASLLLVGCATQGVSTHSYHDKPPVTVKNELIVNKPYSTVWDGLVRELSKSFYVINNIDKESRIINLSFSSNNPVEYVDCGKTKRTYTQGSKSESWEYDVAGSANFKVATPRQEHPAFVNYVVIRRDPSLEGRANIYIAPDEKNSSNSVVTVNTRYILTQKVRGEAFAEHISGNVFSRGRMQDENFTYTFNTNRPGKNESGGGESVTCFSKGKLEEEILDMVKRGNVK